MFTQDEFGRYGPKTPVRGACDHVRRSRKIQYLEVKELNDRLGAYESQIGDLMHAHRKLGRIEDGRAIRQKIMTLWQGYTDLVPKAEAMTDLYLRQLSRKKYAGGKRAAIRRRIKPPRMKRTKSF